MWNKKLRYFLTQLIYQTNFEVSFEYNNIEKYKEIYLDIDSLETNFFEENRLLLLKIVEYYQKNKKKLIEKAYKNLKNKRNTDYLLRSVLIVFCLEKEFNTDFGLKEKTIVNSYIKLTDEVLNSSESKVVHALINKIVENDNLI